MTYRGTHYRTPAQVEALERDEWRCQWCLLVLERSTPATDAHHIFRPRNDYDEPRYIISLCHEHHLGYRHIKGTITDDDIIRLIMIPYIWNGEDQTPKTPFHHVVARWEREPNHKTVQRSTPQEFIE